VTCGALIDLFARHQPDDTAVETGSSKHLISSFSPSLAQYENGLCEALSVLFPSGETSSLSGAYPYQSMRWRPQ